MKKNIFELNSAEDNFSVSKKKQWNHVMPYSHFHSSYEVYYILSGERKFFLKDRTIVIKEGDLIILHPNVLHKTTDADYPEHEVIIINFKEEFLATLQGNFFNTLHPFFQKDYLVIHFSLQHKILVEDMLQQIVKEAQERNSTYEIYIQTLIMQLLIFSSRYIEEHSVEALDYLNPMYERISEVVRYINTHHQKDLSLQYLADKFYISSYYLSRAFKEVTGFTFVEYLNSVRIKEAKKLLEETNLKVYFIAEKVGYRSITHFGRVFKEITGHAPLFYRKRKI